MGRTLGLKGVQGAELIDGVLEAERRWERPLQWPADLGGALRYVLAQADHLGLLLLRVVGVMVTRGRRR